MELKDANGNPTGRFWPSDLESALLRNADLSGAKFKGANLTGADMKGARTAGTQFTDTDLE